ncbi:ABC transporter permease subunit, partial [Rhizobium ruizarguesonis]
KASLTSAMAMPGASMTQGLSSMNSRPLAIITRHILPMCIPSVIVRVTLNMASTIITAAGLGFLGLGAQPPWPEWGSMDA